MAQQEHEDDPPAKRRKLYQPNEEVASTEHQDKTQKGLDRPISPPSSRRRSPERAIEPTWSFNDIPKQTLVTRPLPASKAEERSASEENTKKEPHIVPSPMKLTRIAGLAAHQNVDAVGLGDLLDDPLIKECWNFNFLFDLDFVMYVDASMSSYKEIPTDSIQEAL
jgi:tyrosyl-DNA phosphodiesterase-1